MNNMKNDDKDFYKKYDKIIDSLSKNNQGDIQDDIEKNGKYVTTKTETYIEESTVYGAPKERKSAKIVPLIVMFMFMVAGVVLLYLGISNTIKMMSYEETDAVVISVRTYIGGADDSTLMAVPTYEYYVNGEKYVVESDLKTSVNIAPIVGDIVKIRYDPENPKRIMSNNWTIIIFYVLAIVFGGVGTTCFILALKGKLKFY